MLNDQSTITCSLPPIEESKQLSIFNKTFYPYFDNDIIVNNSPLFLFQSYSNNFPNVSNFPNLIDFRITFDENFYLPSISNFSSIRSKTISITHNFNYNFLFYIDSNPYFSEITIFAKFEKPNSFFNLSSHGYKKMSLGHVGDGNFTTFPNLSLFNGEISISISNLPIKLPVYIGKNQNILLSSKKIKGTIDEYWCNTLPFFKKSSTNEISSSSFKYIKISNDNRVLQGRFINKVLSDGRSTYLSTDIKSDGNTVIATLNLPHFVNQSIIDPDFSVLLDTDFKSECNSENNRKWLIPVAVIVPVVGVSCIGGIIYSIYIKKAIENPLKLKLKKLSK
ncbi:hypothetical protein RB653_010126 [Dictyostelium firmibasis]|uniref:Peptidase A1 domain-containing protein n=1 Tax=Dictyostelium firmibasis TaxID=79012 RepID=A0AAN7TSD7_9MYCE